MVDLSIVIVNYNVKNFLRQTLISVKKSLKDINAEVIIVDNDSKDGSVEMLEVEFPEFELIKSDLNLGFAKANNLALKKARGKYALLLNPDTILQENTLSECLRIMESNDKIGALGVKMIDGGGQFLPESKRGFPSPNVAFYKAFGFSKLFPKSRIFNQYHLGYLDKNESHEVDVLSGAFFFVRKKVLDEIGLLDENFFMYGEDIDLSYRITKAGYINYYLATTRIIHFKGESTKKGSLNYVKVFYKAMMIFANKHFRGKKAILFRGLMLLGIYFRAMMDVISLLFSKSFLPILDFVAIFFGLIIFKNFWEVYYFDDPLHFNGSYIIYHLLIYSVVWIVTIYLYGGYSKKFKIQRIIQGMLFVSLIQLAIYGMLNQHYRPSRMMLVMGTIWSILIMAFNRLCIQFMQHGNFNIGVDREKRVLIVGIEEDIKKTKTILNQTVHDINYVGAIDPHATNLKKGYLQTLDKIDDVIDFFSINEIIWCSNSIKMDYVIQNMIDLKKGILHKIIPDEADSVIGSHSKDTQGEFYSEGVHYNISDPVVQRLKRMWDLVICLLLVIASPILMFSTANLRKVLKAVLKVLQGHSWVGYFEDVGTNQLPDIRRGVFNPSKLNSSITDQMKSQQNRYYAKHYTILMDIKIILDNLKTI